MKQYEASARTVEEAIELGLQELGVSIGDVDVRVVEEGSKGLFGLFGSRPAKVCLTVKDSEADPLGNLLEDKPEKQGKKPEKKAEKKPAEKKPAEKKEPEKRKAKRNRPRKRRRRNPQRRKSPKLKRRLPTNLLKGKRQRKSRKSGRWKSRK